MNISPVEREKKADRRGRSERSLIKKRKRHSVRWMVPGGQGFRWELDGNPKIAGAFKIMTM
jgi:hypothetical protein